MHKRGSYLTQVTPESYTDTSLIVRGTSKAAETAIAVRPGSIGDRVEHVAARAGGGPTRATPGARPGLTAETAGGDLIDRGRVPLAGARVIKLIVGIERRGATGGVALRVVYQVGVGSTHPPPGEGVGVRVEDGEGGAGGGPDLEVVVHTRVADDAPAELRPAPAA